MKTSKFLPLFAVASVAICNSAVASIYFTNFTGYTLGDLDGQGGWSSDSSVADVGYVQSIGGVWGGRAASIGYVNPLDNNSAYVSHAASTPLIGDVNASFSALFQVQDSDEGFGAGAEVRDTFGFRLENSSGDNLFSFYLTPFDQDPTPSTDTGFHTYSWSTGNSAPTPVLIGLASQENFAYTFTVDFFNAGGGNVGFNADVNGSAFSGVLTGLVGEEIAEFGAFWDTTDGGAASGSNFLIFDNVSLVPEPSSALLGLLGATFAFSRRRRA